MCRFVSVCINLTHVKINQCVLCHNTKGPYFTWNNLLCVHMDMYSKTHYFSYIYSYPHLTYMVNNNKNGNLGYKILMQSKMMVYMWPDIDLDDPTVWINNFTPKIWKIWRLQYDDFYKHWICDLMGWFMYETYSMVHQTVEHCGFSHEKFAETCGAFRTGN